MLGWLLAFFCVQICQGKKCVVLMFKLSMSEYLEALASEEMLHTKQIRTLVFFVQNVEYIHMIREPVKNFLAEFFPLS